MKKHIFVAGAAVLALGFAVSTASAQCVTSPANPHPSKAKSLKSSLIQAFVSCGNLGGNTPNAATGGGVPGCMPPETFDIAAGGPAGGWTWGVKGKGDVSFGASKNKVVNILNPADAVDLTVSLKMSGIEDENGAADGTNGVLSTVARATLNDSVGLITVIDFPAGFPITATGGKITKKTSANVLLNGLGLPGLPPCSTIAVVDVTVVDPNGNAFASMGTFLQ